jgi:hypothetical protein
MWLESWKMATVSQALSSFAMAGILALVSGCANRPGPEAEGASKMSNASQQSSAEGLVIVGLLAMKSLRQCSENPQTPCAFQLKSPNPTSD